jgi:uncharacterized protein YjbI with pentapeptide repeats
MDIRVQALLSLYAAGERDFSGWDLSGADLRNVDLRGANFARANFSRAVLAGANFRGAELQEADVSGVYLVLTDLRNTCLYGVTGVLRR